MRESHFFSALNRPGVSMLQIVKRTIFRLSPRIETPRPTDTRNCVIRGVRGGMDEVNATRVL